MSYCADLVRRQDADRFRLALSARRDRREDLCALFAFNHEVAKTRDVVSDPTLGLIRLQWWRDSLDKLYAGQTPQHEVLTALAPAIKARNLPREPFDMLIDAREFDLAGKPAADMTALIAYADATTTPLYALALLILGQDATPENIRTVAVAYALTGLLRAAPFHAGENRILLPHGFSANEIAVQATLPSSPAPFLRAAAALTRVYLNRMKNLDYDLKDPRLNAPPVTFAVKALLGVYR